MEEILNDCVKDSPKFRSYINEQEKKIDNFENSFEKLFKQSEAVLECAKNFQSANASFLTTFQSMAAHFKEDSTVQETIGKFVLRFDPCQNYYLVTLVNCISVINRGLSNFLKIDIKRLKELRRHFLKMSDDLESALVKNAQVYKSKDQDCDETSNQLQLARNCFTKAAMDYLYEINSIQMKKRTEILNMISNYVLHQSLSIQQSNENYTSFSEFSNHVNSYLEILQKQNYKERSNVREQMVLLLKKVEKQSQNDKVLIEPTFDESSEIKMEGYLFKRTSNAFKSWVRRWFILEHNKLYYNSQNYEGTNPSTKKVKHEKSQVILESDLRLCNTSPYQEADRRFCFQIISPSKVHLLQADNEEECQLWMRAIQESSRRAINVQSSYNDSGNSSRDINSSYTLSSRDSFTNSFHEFSTFSKIFVDRIMSTPGNMHCCDCGQPNPSWASINFGVTLCIECSGIHRSFGVHRSKVRSINLDAWDEEDIKVMQRLGNNVVNAILEANVDESKYVKALPTSNRVIRETWIRNKYINRSFIGEKNLLKTTQNDAISLDAVVNLKIISDDLSSESTQKLMLTPLSHFFNEINERNINSLLTDECLSANLPNMLRLLMFGADVNGRVQFGEGFTIPLVQAVKSGDMSPIEFLLLNGAKIDLVDSDDQTALHHAAIAGHAGQICLLLKRKANQYILNKLKQDPLTIAVEKADANVVTILRLARLNEEMRGQDYIPDSASDDFFTDVYRDFSSIDGNHK